MKSLLFVAAVLLSVIGVHLVSIETSELLTSISREEEDGEEECDVQEGRRRERRESGEQG